MISYEWVKGNDKHYRLVRHDEDGEAPKVKSKWPQIPTGGWASQLHQAKLDKDELKRRKRNKRP